MADDGDSRRRVSVFLSACGEAKQRKVDIGAVLARKRAEFRTMRDQIATMKARIQLQAQKLSAKEAACDLVWAQVGVLEHDYANADD